MQKLSRFYKDLKVRHKLLIIFVVQIALPLSLLGFLFYQKTGQMMEQQAVSLSQDILKILGSRVKDFSAQMQMTSQDLLYDQVIYDILHDDRSNNYAFITT